MALDRDDTLRRAEKLLRQGRLDAAIAEYARLVEDQPRDWASANTLGDLYVRAGQIDQAAAQFARIADHFFDEGFLSKAAALYKKILKIRPGDEPSQLRLAEIAARQGLLADAKQYLTAVAEERRRRGDQRGADEIVVRLGALDPGDFEARRAAARALLAGGDSAAAAAALAALATDLIDRGRRAEAATVLRELVHLRPDDRSSRARLARLALEQSDLTTAEELLTPEVAEGDPDLLLACAELQLARGRLDEARAAAADALLAAPALRDRLIQLGWSLCDTQPEAAFVCLEVAADAAAAAGQWADAAALLHEFTTRVPHHIAALMKLVELAVDGGLEATMYLAQAQLADAYLQAGRALEARVIAEDLVAREPWERAHIERFRQALVMLGEPDPDAVIAERLSGSSPFVSTDRFADLFAEELAGAVEGASADRPEATSPSAVAEPTAEPVDEVAPVALQAPSGGSPAPPALVEESGEVSAEPVPLEVDLTAVLEQLAPESPPQAERRPPPADLEAVFQDWREETARRGALDQADALLDRARRAYEQGRFDEAVAALEGAVRSPRHRFEAASLLAQIYRDRGLVGQAVEWLERAVQCPPPTPERGRAALYELGELLEALGESARALAVFLELQAEAGQYRDVDARIERLARVET